VLRHSVDEKCKTTNVKIALYGGMNDRERGGAGQIVKMSSCLFATGSEGQIMGWGGRWTERKAATGGDTV